MAGSAKNTPGLFYMQELSVNEVDRLCRCEEVIEEHLQTFVDVGLALLEIRDSKLYRQYFETFEDYCQKRWKMTVGRAKQLISSVKVISNLKSGTDTIVSPTHESQVRPLAPLSKEEQKEAWTEATNGDEHPTAAKVTKIARKVLEKRTSLPVSDGASVVYHHLQEDEIVALSEAGFTHAEIAEKLGKSARAVRHILEHGKIRRAGETKVFRDDLSHTAQQKFDLAVKQEKHRLAVMAQAVIKRDVEKGIKEYFLAIAPKLKAEQEEAQRIIKGRKGFIGLKTYKKILACLHPDRGTLNREGEELKKIYEEAFRAWRSLERLVLDEKASPTPVDSKSSPMPNTAEEWEEALKKAKQARKDRRNRSGMKVV